jgi:hypothetical protein
MSALSAPLSTSLLSDQPEDPVFSPNSRHYIPPASYQPGFESFLNYSPSLDTEFSESSNSPVTSEFCRSGGAHFVAEEYSRMGLLAALVCFPCGIIYCLNRKQRVCIRCGLKFP